MKKAWAKLVNEPSIEFRGYYRKVRISHSGNGEKVFTGPDGAIGFAVADETGHWNLYHSFAPVNGDEHWIGRYFGLSGGNLKSAFAAHICERTRRGQSEDPKEVKTRDGTSLTPAVELARLHPWYFKA